MKTIIEFQQINFWYEQGKISEFQALKNVTIKIDEGEYVAFFGPSGSGKTSLLYLMAGIERPQKGKVLVNGNDLAKLNENEMAYYRQSEVGIVFQQFNLIPSLSVLDNVALPMAFLGTKERERSARAMELLKRMGINAFAKRYPHELSGGQQQRVGIARALANDPPIVIADEPLGNLDSENANNVLITLKDLHDKYKKTVIMVTHEAWSLRDVNKIFFLKDGVVIKTEVSDGHSAMESLTGHYFKEFGIQSKGASLESSALANLLLRGYSQEEVQRLDNLLSQRFEGKIKAEKFREMLDRPFKNGGLGLWRQKAKEVSNTLEELIKTKKDAKKIMAYLEKHPQAPLGHEFDKIRKFALRDYRGSITYLQVQRFNVLIKNFMNGSLTRDLFIKAARFPVKNNGAGLTFRAAMRAADVMEVLLKKDK